MKKLKLTPQMKALRERGFYLEYLKLIQKHEREISLINKSCSKKTKKQTLKAQGEITDQPDV